MDFDIDMSPEEAVFTLERCLSVERYAWLSLSLDMAMIVTLDGLIEDVNTHWEHVTGHGHGVLQGSYLIEYIHFDDRERALADLQRLIASDIGSASMFFRFSTADGTFKRLNWNVIFSPDHDCYFCMVTDASNEGGRDQLAYRDVLTGLSNRLALEDKLPATLTQTCSLGVDMALIFLDLDGFKEVNDTLGHKAGDTLLVKAAKRMKAAVGDFGEVYRLGGDEFVGLISNCSTRDEVLEVAQGVLKELQRAFMVDDNRVSVGASLGIALCPSDANDPATLMDMADQAMYHVKRAGKNSIVFYGEMVAPVS